MELIGVENILSVAVSNANATISIWHDTHQRRFIGGCWGGKRALTSSLLRILYPARPKKLRRVVAFALAPNTA